MNQEASRSLREENLTPRARGAQETWALEEGRWHLPVGQVGFGALGVAAERAREKTGEESITKASQCWPLGFSHLTPPPFYLLAREEHEWENK